MGAARGGSGGGTWGGPGRGYRRAAPPAPPSTRPQAPAGAPTGPAVRGGSGRGGSGRGMPRQGQQVAREVSPPSAETVKRQEDQYRYWKVIKQERQGWQGETANVPSLDDRISAKVEKRAPTPAQPQSRGNFQIRGAFRNRGNNPFGQPSTPARSTQAMRPPPPSPSARPSAPPRAAPPAPAPPPAAPVSQSGDIAVELARINLERERLIWERERDRLATERERDRIAWERELERLASERKQADHERSVELMQLTRQAREDRGRSRETSTRSRRYDSRSASPRRRGAPHYDDYRTPRGPPSRAPSVQYGYGDVPQVPTGPRYPIPVTPAPAFVQDYAPVAARPGAQSTRGGPPRLSREDYARHWKPGAWKAHQAFQDSRSNSAKLREREKEMQEMKERIAAMELIKKRKAEAADTTTATAERLPSQTSTTRRVVDEERPASAIGDTAPVLQPEKGSTASEGLAFSNHVASAREYIDGLEANARGFEAAWWEAYDAYLINGAPDERILYLFQTRMIIENDILCRVLALLDDVRGRLNDARTVIEVDNAIDFLNMEGLRLGIDERRAFSNRELLKDIPKEELGPLVAGEFTGK